MPVTASTSSVMTALKKAVIGVIGVNVNVTVTPKLRKNASDGVNVIRHDGAQKGRNWRNRRQRQRHDVQPCSIRSPGVVEWDS
ncbi:hypothetical protein GPALN_005933 [Globodera pallida]|nr:hypothetical protein GPALN_005933 [Globodera pallida]